MISLCQNRPEGFGPTSSLHPRLPTTCFVDVIVEPLPTWIFLVALLIVHSSRVTTSRRNLDGRQSPFFKPFGEYRTSRSTHPRRGILSRFFSVLYYVLMLALFAMVSLEIARLVAAQLGIGLLPFTYVGVLLALANRLLWRSRNARHANIAYWLMLAAAMSIKVATEQEEQMSSAIRVKGDGTAGNYPTSDEVLDNVVMVGVEILLAVLELNGAGKLDS